MIEYARCIYNEWLKQYSSLSQQELEQKQPEFLKLVSGLLHYTEQELDARLSTCPWYFK